MKILPETIETNPIIIEPVLLTQLNVDEFIAAPVSQVYDHYVLISHTWDLPVNKNLKVIQRIIKNSILYN